MTKMLMWFIKAVLELLGFFLIVGGTLMGPDVVAAFGFSGNVWLGFGFGFLFGVALASFFVGMPLILVSIGENVGRSVDLLGKIEKSLRVERTSTLGWPTQPPNDNA